MLSVEDLIKIALAEDIGSGDITTDNIVPNQAKGEGRIIAKEPLVIAGLDVAGKVFEQLETAVTVESEFKDGDTVHTGEAVLTINGTLRTLLLGERTALNFLQHLSGIATFVKSYVDCIAAKNVRLVDTRKTAPGLRTLEKYAVRTGGGYNHRMGLYDGVLIKDNHIAACGGVARAIEKIRRHVHHLVKIEVEVTNESEIKDALSAAADVIMLDNMNIDQIKKAVKIINGKALVEVSGGVTKGDLADLAEAGVDIISSGALTHSARSVDLSMQIVPVD